MSQTATVAVLLCLIGIASPTSAQPAQDLPRDAVSIYLRAAGNGFAVQGPAESPLLYSEYPPYPPEWHKLAKASREANADRLKPAREARSAPPGTWPRGANRGDVNALRGLAWELADAAVYEHTQGNHAEAIELARDVLALGRSLRTGAGVFETNIAIGVEAVAANRLMVMAPGLAFAKDKADRRNVSPVVLREVIQQLLAPRDVKAEASAALKAEPAPKPGQQTISGDHLMLYLNRSCAEQRMLAMSLACQLYRGRTGRWPESAAQLVPADLPNLPADPFGSGRDSIGYVLSKDGLPDGGDRPLVYSRDNSKDGLFFRLDEPFYSFYSGDGSGRLGDERKQGGEFRDVARWAPAKLAPGAPRTRKLPEPVL
jgi:hypothetical protein